MQAFEVTNTSSCAELVRGGFVVVQIDEYLFKALSGTESQSYKPVPGIILR
jgi:hypothetical protein